MNYETWVSLGILIFLSVLVILLFVEIRKSMCLHKAYKQRDAVREQLVLACSIGEISDARLALLTGQLYDVPIKSHAKQLFWFDAPCLIYDKNLWGFMPMEMFDGYDEDVEDVLGEVITSPHAFKQAPRDAVNDERQTFVVPEGYYAVLDDEGRATGEIRKLKTKSALQTKIEAANRKENNNDTY